MEKAVGCAPRKEPSFLQERGGTLSNAFFQVLPPITFKEYAARLIISLSSIIDAVEIDPVTKHKAYCMQVITDDKNYRLCAPSEEALARWLGALKSQLMRKKEGFSKAQGAT